MRLFQLSNKNYLFIQDRSDEEGIDITLYDKDKKLVDGGILETDIDIDSEEAIKDSLCFMDLDSSKLTWKELDCDLIEDFED